MSQTVAISLSDIFSAYEFCFFFLRIRNRHKKFSYRIHNKYVNLKTCVILYAIKDSLKSSMVFIYFIFFGNEALNIFIYSSRVKCSLQQPPLQVPRIYFPILKYRFYPLDTGP